MKKRIINNSKPNNETQSSVSFHFIFHFISISLSLRVVYIKNKKINEKTANSSFLTKTKCFRRI